MIGKKLKKGKTYHFTQSIEDALMDWTEKDWKVNSQWMLDLNNEKFKSGRDLKKVFLEEAFRGHRVVPVEGCDNFDYHQGCLGHDKG